MSERPVVVVPGLALVSENIFLAAQRRLASRRAKASRTTKYTYLLQGRLRCACGLVFGGRRLREGLRYYRCNGGKDRTPNYACKIPSFRVEQLEAAVWTWIEEKLTNPEWVRKTLEQQRDQQQHRVGELNQELALYRKQRQEAEDEYDNLAVLVARGVAREGVLVKQKALYDQLMPRLDCAIEEVEYKLSQVILDEDIERVAAWVEDFGAVARNANFEDRKRFLEICQFSARIVRRDDLYQLRVSAVGAVEDFVPIVSKRTTSE